MLEYGVIVGLILIAGYWIIRPVLKLDSFDDVLDPKTDDEHRRLMLQKEAVYATLRELEFDVQMGKLSTADYEELKNQYKKEAIDCLKAIEDLEKIRNRMPASTESDPAPGFDNDIAASFKTATDESSPMFCSQCGTKVARIDRFCFACGSRLIKPQARFVSGLKAKYTEGLEQ